MAWLRLDDGFTKHPKFSGWNGAQKWAWLEVMEYCARYETGGRIPDDPSILPRSTTPALLAKALDSGWLDVRDDGSKWVHDFEIFNPPRLSGEALDEVVFKLCSEHPDESANALANRVHGRRKEVLASIRRFRGGSQTGSQSQSGTGSASGSGTGSRARARPVPPQPPLGEGSTVSETPSVPVPEVEVRRPDAGDDIDWDSASTGGTGAGMEFDEREKGLPRRDLELIDPQTALSELREAS